MSTPPSSFLSFWTEKCTFQRQSSLTSHFFFFFPVQTVFHFSSPSVLMTLVIHSSARSHSPLAFMSKNKESPVTPSWPRTGFRIDPDNTDSTIHKWQDAHSFWSTHGLSFLSVSNRTTHKQAGFYFIQIAALRHAPIHFQPLQMVFTHLAPPPDPRRFRLWSWPLIRSYNRSDVKSQYCRHCPCHPSIHPSATTAQEQLAQLGQRNSSCHMETCFCFGELSVRVW